jgi:transcriptional regulator with XRE-family HTH domain
MTPDNLRTARKALGLTQRGLAEALRMGKWGWQTISKWENGSVPVPGPAQVAIEMLLKERI